MYYKTFLKKGAFIVAASLLTLAACKRNDTTSNATPALTSADDNGGYASDAARLDNNNNDVLSITDIAATTGTSGLRTTTSACATITFDSSGSTHVMTINFGTTDCTCLDGKRRRGEIIVTYTGRYKDSGSTHTITFNNYHVNDIQFTGTKTVTNMGTNSLGQYYYNVTVNDSVIYASDSIASWTGSRTRTWIAGYSTADRSDDVYNIAGTTTLTRANHHVFTYAIGTPLKIAYDCDNIESGTVTVSSSSFATGSRTIDYSYGTGGCDNEALLTIGSHTYVIYLR